MARKYARIFVRGHYLFRDVNSFRKKRNFSLLHGFVCLAYRKLADQGKTALKVDSSEGIDDQPEEGVDSEKAEGNQDEGKLDTTKKSNISRGESKQSHISQDTGKKADGKKGAASNKDSLTQTVPDLEEEELCRDCAMIGVSMGTAVTGAKIKGVSLYEHLAKLSGKEVFYHLFCMSVKKKGTGTPRVVCFLFNLHSYELKLY